MVWTCNAPDPTAPSLLMEAQTEIPVKPAHVNHCKCHMSSLSEPPLMKGSYGCLARHQKDFWKNILNNLNWLHISNCILGNTFNIGSGQAAGACPEGLTVRPSALLLELLGAEEEKFPASTPGNEGRIIFPKTLQVCVQLALHGEPHSDTLRIFHGMALQYTCQLM